MSDDAQGDDDYEEQGTVTPMGAGQEDDDEPQPAHLLEAPQVQMSPEDREADEAAARRAGQIVEHIIQNQQGNRGFVPPSKQSFQQGQGGGRRNRRRGRGRDRDDRHPNANRDQRGNFQPQQHGQHGHHGKGHQYKSQFPQHSNQPRPVPNLNPEPRPPQAAAPIVEEPLHPDMPGAQAALSVPQEVAAHTLDHSHSNYAEVMDDASADIYEPQVAGDTGAPASVMPSDALIEGEGGAVVDQPIAAKIPQATGQRQRPGRNWRDSTYESSSVTPQQAPSNVRKVVLLNSTEPGEIRVAILENGELAEIFMERKSHYQQAGNIYKGRVVNVEPSLQAAFIDLGAERNGFLHASDVIPPSGGYDDVLDKKGGDRGRQQNQQQQSNKGQQPQRDQRGYRDRKDFREREKGATPPSVLAAQQAQASGVVPEQPGAQGPLLLNRPARPSTPHQASFQRPPDTAPRQIPPQEFATPLDLTSPAIPVEPPPGSGALPDAQPSDQPHDADYEPMPIVPGQPYHGQAHAPAPTYGQQQQGHKHHDQNRRRRRRGGRGRQNRARFPGPAPMLAPQNRHDPLTPRVNQLPYGQFAEPAHEHEDAPQSGDSSEPKIEELQNIAVETSSVAQETSDAAPVTDAAATNETQVSAEPETPHPDVVQQSSDVVPPAPASEPEPVAPSQPSEAAPDAANASSEAPASTSGDSGRMRELGSRLDAAAELADQVEEVVQPPGASGIHMAEDSNLADTREHSAVDITGEAARHLDADVSQTTGIEDVVTREHEPVQPVTGQQPQTYAQQPGQQQRKNNFRNGKDRGHDRRYTIQEMLREGQEVLVQVAKEGIGQKGPALTTYISLPGRYLVLMPAVSRLGVSKRIDSEEQRRALKDSLAQLNCPDDMGVIVRTAGMGRSKDELQRDMEYLMRAWEGLKEKTRGTRTPSLIYQEGDVVTRVFRDVLTEDVTEIIIDDPMVMERATEFLKETSPGSERKLRLYSEAEPLFHRYNVEQQMQRLFNRKVNLRNGGSIVIEQTEALVAIDVNTGRYREKRNQDDTILQTNLEAAREIARQLRLRDIGGLVMIDFIDMEIHEHRRRVERELKAHLARDKAKINVLPVSSLGVVEMTRQRIRHSLRKTLFDRCPHCGGVGHVKSPESIGLEMLREIKSQVRDKFVKRVKVQLNPHAAYAILNQFRKDLVRMEEANGITIEVCGDPGVALSQMQVSTAKESGDWVLKKVSEVDDYVRNS